MSSDLTCTNPGCTPPDTLTVVVTFANSGGQDGPATPTLSVNGTYSGVTPSEGATITVPAGGLATATFTGVTLAAGSNKDKVRKVNIWECNVLQSICYIRHT